MTRTRTTPIQARLLGALRDGRVASLDELAERLGEEIEQGVLPGDEALSSAVPEAVEGLVEAGLVHRVNEQLVTVSWRGLRGEAAPDPGEGGELRVFEPPALRVGAVEPLDSGDAFDLVGGAENLPSPLEQALTAGAAARPRRTRAANADAEGGSV